MDRLRRLDWEPRFTMHDEVIDLQHKHLFMLTNTLMDKHASGAVDCYESIKDLMDYASKHFHAEQILMMQSEYPDYQRQLEEHEFFTKRINEFIQGCKNKEACLTWEVLSFLRDWIFFHTTGLDLKLGEHLLKTHLQNEARED